MSYGAGVATGVVFSVAVFLVLDKPLSKLGERLRDWIFHKRRSPAPASGTWYVDLPCPQCGLYNVFGVSLVLQGFGHNHTKYFCRSWIKPEQGPDQGVPCGWWGWSVPGWDAPGG